MSEGTKIEFRWLQSDGQKVLQFRDGRMVMAMKSGGYTKEEQGTYEMLWLGSQWQDIQTVTIESSAAGARDGD